MQFLRESQETAEKAIAKTICDALFEGKRVLWLTSGGSNIAPEVAIMQRVTDHCADKLDGLAVMPMDERYGEPGHKDSNSEALRVAGFNAGRATWVDVLTHNEPFEQTVSFYGDVAATALANAQVIVGQFGLGNDAHVAGILPASPATAPGSATVVGYEWSDYVRMTLSAEALQQITVGYVLAYGDAKKEALTRLRANAEPFEQLPAKLLYELPEVYVYNDQLNETESEE